MKTTMYYVDEIEKVTVEIKGLNKRIDQLMATYRKSPAVKKLEELSAEAEEYQQQGKWKQYEKLFKEYTEEVQLQTEETIKEFQEVATARSACFSKISKMRADLIGLVDEKIRRYAVVKKHLEDDSYFR